MYIKTHTHILYIPILYMHILSICVHRFVHIYPYLCEYVHMRASKYLKYSEGCSTSDCSGVLTERCRDSIPMFEGTRTVWIVLNGIVRWGTPNLALCRSLLFTGASAPVPEISPRFWLRRNYFLGSKTKPRS